MDETVWTIDGIRCKVFEGQHYTEPVPGFPYRYESRHDDYLNLATPRTIEIQVAVNFWGTIYAEQPFPLVDGLHNIKLAEFDHDGGTTVVYDADDPFFAEDGEADEDEEGGDEP